MSVFTNPKISTYEAPLSISPKKVVISGSWSLVPTTSDAMTPCHLLRFRLHTWKQQVAVNLKQQITEACFDWVMKNENGQLQHFAVVKLTGQYTDSFSDDHFLQYISSVIVEQNQMILAINQAIVQQLHPGVGLDTS